VNVAEIVEPSGDKRELKNFPRVRITGESSSSADNGVVGCRTAEEESPETRPSEQRKIRESPGDTARMHEHSDIDAAILLEAEYEQDLMNQNG
jgi:hypothetical protein